MRKARVRAVDALSGVCSVQTVTGAQFDAAYLHPAPVVDAYVFMEDVGDGSWVIVGSLGGAANVGPFTGKYFWTAEDSAELPFIFCAAQAISRTDYAGLFSKLSTTYGVGDGSTTFNVPDGRGRGLLALDNMVGSDAGRLSVANTLGGTGGSQALPAHVHRLSTATGGAGAGAVIGAGNTFAGGLIESTGTGGDNLPPYMLANLLVHI